MLQSPTDLDLFRFLYNTLLLLSIRNGCSQFNAVQCSSMHHSKLSIWHLRAHCPPPPPNPLGSRKLLAICVPAVPGSELLKSFVYAAYQVGEHPSYNSHSYHLTQTKGLASSYPTVSCLFFNAVAINLWLRVGVEDLGSYTKLFSARWISFSLIVICSATFIFVLNAGNKKRRCL